MNLLGVYYQPVYCIWIFFLPFIHKIINQNFADRKMYTGKNNNNDNNNNIIIIINIDDDDDNNKTELPFFISVEAVH